MYMNNIGRGSMNRQHEVSHDAYDEQNMLSPIDMMVKNNTII